MPNHVTHKIVFDAEHKERVFSECCPYGKFDFETLIPMPIYVYRGNLSAEDSEDFQENWHSWGTKNWGTKWNCYDCSVGEIDGKAFIKFDTAWSVPYPVISAFCNKFSIPFEHRYFDEGENFWGVEIWGKNERSDNICRIQKHLSREKDKQTLFSELKGE